MLYAQGFHTAEALSSKVDFYFSLEYILGWVLRVVSSHPQLILFSFRSCSFFNFASISCQASLTTISVPVPSFFSLFMVRSGLRALKSVLRSAGDLKRESLVRKHDYIELWVSIISSTISYPVQEFTPLLVLLIFHFLV